MILGSLLSLTLLSCDKFDSLSCWECVQTYYKIDTQTVIGSDKEDVCDKTRAEIKQMETSGQKVNVQGHGAAIVNRSCSKK